MNLSLHAGLVKSEFLAAYTDQARSREDRNVRCDVASVVAKRPALFVPIIDVYIQSTP